MIQRPFRTDCKQLPPRSRGQPPPEQRRKRAFDKLRIWVLSLESMPFQISPGFHPQITDRAFTPAAVRDTHSPCCLAQLAQSRTFSAPGVVMKSHIRVLSVDDLPVIREGIVAVINGQPDMQVEAQASNGHEAVEC